jgi:hypothetical protein
MKAFVLYTVADSTHEMRITGHRIVMQAWDDGKTRIAVHRKNGKRKEVHQLKLVWHVKVTYGKGDVG